MRLLSCLFLILAALPARAEDAPFTVRSVDRTVAFDSMLATLAKADVVFIGEQHDHAQGHVLELAILKGLADRKSNIALAMEMFERDVQPVLDEYLHGFISEASFTAASRPWPAYKTDYRPMVELCKERKIPVIASNAPRRYVSMVSRGGQEALAVLPRESRRHLATLPYSMEVPAEYDRQLTAIFESQHMGAGNGSAQQPAMPSVSNMKQAQELWDATMADSIVRNLKRGRLIVHVNGSMHSDSLFGIAARVKQSRPAARVMNVTIRPSAAYPAAPNDVPASAANYVIVTPEAPKKVGGVQ